MMKKICLLLLFLSVTTFAQEDLETSTEEAQKATVDVQAQWQAFQEARKERNLQMAKRIDQLAINGQSISVEQYLEVNTLWREVANGLKDSIENPYTEKFQELSNKDDKVLNYWRKQVAHQFGLLKQIGQKRLRAIKLLRESGHNPFLVDDKILSNIFLEIQMVPYKLRSYLHEKSFWFKESITGGVKGIFGLLWEVFLLLLMFIVPFFFIKSTGFISKILEEQKKRSLYLSYKSKFHHFLTVYLPIFAAIMPWLLGLLAISLATSIVDFSEFNEIKFIFPYFRYYIYYKIFRILLEFGLKNFASQFDIQQSDISKKAQQTSLILGLFLLFIYSIKQAFQSILGSSLTFSLFEPLFVYSIVVVLFYLARKWKPEIVGYLKQTRNKYLETLAEWCEEKYSFLLSFPLLFVVVIHYISVAVGRWSSQFEVVKLLYAKILRIKFESSKRSNNLDQELPEEYQISFIEAVEDTESLIELDNKFVNKIFAQMKSWTEDETDEQTVAIFGDKGAGKSRILKHFKNEKEKENYDVKLVKVPARTFTKKNLEAFLDSCDLGEKNSSEERNKVVLIDDAHNLFLSTIGGFETYKNFLEIIESRRDVFWVVCFNEQTWIHLNSVLGENQYFRLELRVPKWNLEKIKKFILKASEKTSYKIQYDQIFKSSQSIQEGETSAENRYFYLLWERSGGNPGLSIEIWFKSLNPAYEKNLIVSLPRDNEVSELSYLHQDMHFTYASVVKHENLTLSEATVATNLPRAIVKQALYRGLEEGFLHVQAGRYRVSKDWSYDVQKYLKGKNLLYE